MPSEPPGERAFSTLPQGAARISRARGPRFSRRTIVVCTTTTPAWTPLFASIGGIVTDTGGILSHAAVVAREYGLPAVVGAEIATRAVPDGDRVEIDVVLQQPGRDEAHRVHSWSGS
ncbi:MAG: PEP-utilizing enzyme [Solirubrobacteraceae bacterium]